MEKLIRPNIIAQSGYVVLCQYCGEQTGNSQKYCKQCKTQSGRKEIFEANVKILKENGKKGYTIPETIKSYK